MENAENFSDPINATVLARKSWIAYLAPTFFCAVALYVLGSLVMPLNRPVAISLWLLCVTVYFYILLSIRSYMLFINDNGVWIFSGVFPWTKGVSGVKWRDLDAAVYYQNFLSWLFGAYTIRISHRFTRSAEIRLTVMHHGQLAVQQINTIQQSMLANLRASDSVV